MIKIPDNATKIEVTGATVDFFVFALGDDTFFAFDTSMCEPPEPMVNAMAGLMLIDAPDKKLLMINHKNPGALFSKIGDDFDSSVTEREDGLFEIVFGFKGAVDMGDSRYTASCHG